VDQALHFSEFLDQIRMGLFYGEARGCNELHRGIINGGNGGRSMATRLRTPAALNGYSQIWDEKG
jgi:hypothetical protein